MASNSLFQAVIFDMDGVLIDSEGMYIEWEIEDLSKRYPFLKPEDMYPTVGMSGQDYPKYMAKLLKEDANDPQFLYHLHAAGSNRKINYAAIMNPQAKEILDELKNNGIRIALASSSSKENINQVLSDCQILNYFELIITGFDFKNSKPEPDIYLETFRQLKLEPQQCLIVEDSTYGIQAAKAAKGTVTALTDNRFGFDQSQADYQIKNLLEIMDIIMKH